MMEHIGLILALAGLAMETVALIAGCVWVVSKIGSTTDVLSSEIKHLAEAISSLKHWVNEVDKKSDDHAQRIAVLEAQKK